MKILVFNKDSPKINSAYGKLGREIWINRVAKYEKYRNNIAFYATVPATMYCGEFDGVPIYSNGGEDLEKGEDFLIANYRHWNSDVYFTMMDPHVFNETVKLSAQGIINWITMPFVDYFPMPPYIYEMLSKAMLVVPPTKWAEDLLKLKLDNVTNHVHMGIDSNIFKSDRDSKADTRKDHKRLKTLHVKEDTFIITIVANNQLRKPFPEWFRAIQLFRESNPDTDIRVYIHSQQRIISQWMLDELSRFYGIDDICRWSDAYMSYTWRYTDRELAGIYEVSDVVLVPAHEGFSMPVIEAAGCGTQSISLNFGAQKELMESITPELLVKVGSTFQMPNLLMKFLPDEDDTLNKLNYVLNCDQEKYFKKLQDYAHSNFDWDKCIMPRFYEMLGEIENELDRRCIKIPDFSGKSEINILK